MMPLSDIEERRGRLLVSVFLLLTAFAALAVIFSLVGPSMLEPLQGTPTAARIGILILTIGFIALVWEKERGFRSLSQRVASQEVLLAGFESRVRVIDELLDATDRVGAPLAIDDVMSVILDAAVELVGAESGTIELADDDGDVTLMRRKTTGKVVHRTRSRTFVRLPLVASRRELARLTLALPEDTHGIGDEMQEVIERFCVQAAAALEKAHLLARERATVAHLEAANFVKARFLTTVSHELRTPLTSVIGFASTLNNHWHELDEEMRREFTAEIEENGHRLGEIVERLLETARIELQGLLVAPVLHDVRFSTIAALAQFSRDDLEERLDIVLPSDEVEAELDPFVVDQLVTNLVDNALRYTTGPVRLTVDAHENNIMFRVGDVGEGMDRETLATVTDPFYRFDDTLDGRGMGLHIVRMLVESHGGRGQIESDHRGTTAVFVLPRFRSEGVTSRVLDSARA